MTKKSAALQARFDQIQARIISWVDSDKIDSINGYGLLEASCMVHWPENCQSERLFDIVTGYIAHLHVTKPEAAEALEGASLDNASFQSACKGTVKALCAAYDRYMTDHTPASGAESVADRADTGAADDTAAESDDGGQGGSGADGDESDASDKDGEDEDEDDGGDGDDGGGDDGRDDGGDGEGDEDADPSGFREVEVAEKVGGDAADEDVTPEAPATGAGNATKKKASKKKTAKKAPAKKAATKKAAKAPAKKAAATKNPREEMTGNSLERLRQLPEYVTSHRTKYTRDAWDIVVGRLLDGQRIVEAGKAAGIPASSISSGLARLGIKLPEALELKEAENGRDVTADNGSAPPKPAPQPAPVGGSTPPFDRSRSASSGASDTPPPPSPREMEPQIPEPPEDQVRRIQGFKFSHDFGDLDQITAENLFERDDNLETRWVPKDDPLFKSDSVEGESSDYPHQNPLAGVLASNGDIPEPRPREEWERVLDRLVRAQVQSEYHRYWENSAARPTMRPFLTFSYLARTLIDPRLLPFELIELARKQGPDDGWRLIEDEVEKAARRLAEADDPAVAIETSPHPLENKPVEHVVDLKHTKDPYEQPFEHIDGTSA